MERDKKLMFSLVRHAADTNVTNVSSRLLRQLTAEPNLHAMIKLVRSGKADVKRQLPAICWAAHFEDNKRHLESASWTGLCYIDIDHISQFYTKEITPSTSQAEAFYEEFFGGREDELQIVHAQVSPGGDGLHIIFIPETIENLPQAQADFARKAGIEQYDAACKDLSRMLFLSPISDTLYDALDTLCD